MLVAALLRLIGWLAALPYAFVLALVLTGPPTWSGALYVLAIGAVVVGMATVPIPIEGREGGKPAASAAPKTRRPRGITRIGVAVIAAVACARGCAAADGSTMHLTDGSGASSRFLDRVVDEADVAIAGTRVLTASGMLRDDAPELPSAMRAAYAEMRSQEGDAPSPVLATYAGLQDPDAFDLVVIDPPTPAPMPPPVAAPAAQPPPSPATALVFLHGYAGNFDLPCWQIARAVAPLGVVTACPSTRWVGDWWSPDGERIVRRTVDVLRARGMTRLFLAGLSNGGYGAARLAPRMKGTFAALVLISGAAPDASPPGIPTLVVHGTKDTMAPVDEARAYASEARGRFVGLDAGHFAMLVRRDEHDRAVRDFLRPLADGGRVKRAVGLRTP